MCLAVKPRKKGEPLRVCTREAGHDGEHVACLDNKEHTTIKWENG